MWRRLPEIAIVNELVDFTPRELMSAKFFLRHRALTLD
jgi:hypothetical protein